MKWNNVEHNTPIHTGRVFITDGVHLALASYRHPLSRSPKAGWVDQVQLTGNHLPIVPTHYLEMEEVMESFLRRKEEEE